MQKKLGFLIYENAQPIDIIGPWEVFSFWKSILKAPLDLFLIGEKKGAIKLDSQITLHAHQSFLEAPSLNYLIIPGGKGRNQEVKNQNLIAFLQKQAHECEYLLSVCTGMFLLAAAGLLKDHCVTTYWRALPEAKTHPEIKLKEERIVKSGKIWTSAGVTSGIDLALAFIEEIAGRQTAGKVELLLEYFPSFSHYSSQDTIEELPPYQNSFEYPCASLPRYLKERIK